MKIKETNSFRKSYKALPAVTQKKAKKQFELLLVNLFHPSLHTEKLEPKHNNIWSFRIDKSYRVIFTFQGNEIILLINIGPHDIYKK